MSALCSGTITVQVKIDFRTAEPIRICDVPKSLIVCEFLRVHVNIHPSVPKTHKDGRLYRQDDGKQVFSGIALADCMEKPDDHAVVLILKPPVSVPHALADEGVTAAVADGVLSRQYASGEEKLKAHLRLLRITPERSVISAIAENGWLCTRIDFADETKHLLRVYEEARLIPNAETRANVMADHNLIVGDLMPVSSGANTAVFLQAFLKTAAGHALHVLKIPMWERQVDYECALYNSLKSIIPPDVRMVPVRALQLRREHAHEGVSVPSQRAILMPFYGATAAAFMNRGIPLDDLEYLFDSIARTLRFINDQGWLHGDVKPSNIFFEPDGTPVLGDFGSAVTLDSVETFVGGTPAFQCTEVRLGRATDMAGLIISCLVISGSLSLAAAPTRGWPASAIHCAILAQENVSWREKLLAAWAACLTTVRG